MRITSQEPVVTEWLRVIKGVKRPVVNGKNSHLPGAEFTHVLKHDAPPFISTPCTSWDTQGRLAFGCSLCREACTGSTHIRFNPVMPRPYTFTCGQCQLKMTGGN